MLWGCGAGTTASTATTTAVSGPADSSTFAVRHPFSLGVASDSPMIGLRDVFVVAPTAAGGDQPMIPLLSTSPYQVEDHNRNAAATIHLWQHQKQPSSLDLNPNPNFRKPMAMPLATMLDSSSGASAANFAQPISSISTATCRDCGNLQAKKDCTHRRCRTFSKSRGFDCSTHIKSTWVPAARRRETHLAGAVGSSGWTSASKKPRLSTAAVSNANTPRSSETSSSHQEESLPGQVRVPAVFKCVKVTSVASGQGEFAYQAMVRIGGHVFKGFLYDEGLKAEIDRNGDEVNKDGGGDIAVPRLSELHLGGGGGTSDVHAGGTALMGGGGGAATYTC